ncbi:MAG: hypothetical protein GY855_05155, partial [candidate division Zixibacteria bacterium]|nr:hypothetical protein [candidate division Zixibacteria bacterium]
DLYYQMYKPEQAFPNHNKALEMAHELGDEELIGELLSSLAFDNLASGDIDKAYKLAKDAYDISKRIGVRIYMIKALNALVEIYLERQDNELDTCVAKLLESAKDDFSEYGSNAHYLIGKYYQSKNNPLQAKGFFSSALERAIKGGFKKLEWESRFMLGQLMTSSPEEKEFFSLGMKELETAVEIVSSTASTLTSEENASDFLKIPQIKEILEFKSRT